MTRISFIVLTMGVGYMSCKYDTKLGRIQHTHGTSKTGEMWIISVDCVNVNILIMIFCKILLVGGTTTGQKVYRNSIVSQTACEATIISKSKT